jgi:hypothetical protein
LYRNNPTRRKQMEAVEKNFQDLVTSEEEPTTAVTTDVEDEIIQQCLTSEDEVEETTEVEESEELEEGILDDDDIEALSAEEGWEDVSEEDLAEMEAVIAELKAENPDLDLDEVDIVINEDGEIEILERSKNPYAKVPKSKLPPSMGGTGKVKKYKKRTRPNKKRTLGSRSKKGTGTTRMVKGRNSFDPSEVAADSAVAMGEEEKIDEYTAGSQTRPTNVTVWRTIGGTVQKVKRWTSKGKKGINKGPKSAAHKLAISKPMKRSKAVKKPHGGGGADETFNPTEVITALSTGEELSETFKEKASVIFESAVNNEVEKQMELAEVEVHKVFEEEFDTAVDEITSKTVDEFLTLCEDEGIKDIVPNIDMVIDEIATRWANGSRG